jgi:hypothetical protein
MMFFFSLALMKRFSELHDLVNSATQGSSVKGRGYRRVDLELVSTLGVASGVTAVLVLAMYLYLGSQGNLIQINPLLWLVVPTVLLWISRIWLIAHRGDMDDDPVLYSVRDRFTWGVAICISALVGFPYVADWF